MEREIHSYVFRVLGTMQFDARENIVRICPDLMGIFSSLVTGRFAVFFCLWDPSSVNSLLSPGKNTSVDVLIS